MSVKNVKLDGPIVFVPHYLSVDVYYELAFNFIKDSFGSVHLLVLSENCVASIDQSQKIEIGFNCFETDCSNNAFDNLNQTIINKLFSKTNWGELIASERSFTDSSFTFGGIGHREEDATYINQLVTKLVSFFYHYYSQLKPSFVIGVYGDNIYNYIGTAVAEEMDISIIIPHASYINPSDFNGGGYFAHNRYLESKFMSRTFQELLHRELTKNEKEQAIEFRDMLKGYQSLKILKDVSESYNNAVSQQIFSIFSYLNQHKKYNKNVYFYKIDFIRKLKANFLRLYRKFHVSRFLNSRLTSLPSKIVFYPMHFQPEASTLVGGIYYCNQIALIENLSKTLPLGYTLIIKEHPRGRGVRPLWQYKHLESLYNVKFSDLDSKEILQRSNAVVTISGTIALEALAFKVPVLVLGRSYHTFHSAYYYVSDFQSISKTLRRVLIENSDHCNDEVALKVFYAYLRHLFDFYPFGKKRKVLNKVLQEHLMILKKENKH